MAIVGPINSLDLNGNFELFEDYSVSSLNPPAIREVHDANVPQFSSILSEYGKLYHDMELARVDLHYRVQFATNLPRIVTISQAHRFAQKSLEEYEAKWEVFEEEEAKLSSLFDEEEDE